MRTLFRSRVVHRLPPYRLHSLRLRYSHRAKYTGLHDNFTHGTENGHSHEGHFNKNPSRKIIEVDTKTWEATLVQAFDLLDGLLAKSQDSTQILPNGNALQKRGSEVAVTEFKADGTPIFHAYLESGFLAEGVEIYRGYRYNWTGIPNEAPAIVALKNDGAITVYISWNSGTRTKIWRFYEVDDRGRRSYLGKSRITSLETKSSLKDDVKSVQAEVFDSRGFNSKNGARDQAVSWQKTGAEERPLTGLVELLTFKVINRNSSELKNCALLKQRDGSF